jgi:uncharacterized repeat protein (TIGR02543 family)
LTIPNSVTSIGSYAFRNCSRLTTVNFNAVNCTQMGSSDYPAFSGCTALATLNIGSGVTRIPDYAFYYCRGLTGALTIPNSVTSIGSYAFYGCSGLTGALTIPNSVTSIGPSAFPGCSGLTGTLTIGNSVTSIGERAFYNCNGLTGALTIPNSVTSIGNYAFSGCSGLTGALIIPNSVTSIGSSAFSGCRGLTGALTIPNSVTSIGNDAFSLCSGLTGALTIGNSVTSIGYDAFSFCSGLTGALTIGNSVTSIGDGAFLGCRGLTGALTIPNSVTSIGYDAFSGCSGLTSVTIPNSVTTIGYEVFYGCSGLTSVTIPNSVTTIGYEAFYGCSGLTSVTIPNSVTTIGNYAFSGCSGLTSVINSSLTPQSISSDVFYGIALSNCTLYVPSASRTAYSTANVWRDFGWIENAYILSFNANGGTVSPDSKAVGGNAPVGNLPIPTRTGYTFTRWDTAQNGSGTDYTAETPYTATNATTLYAQWILTTYAIAYENLHGAGHSNPTSYSMESAAITLTNPGTRAGYTFAGWSPTGGIPAGSTGDKTFTAQWTANTYTLTFNATGGTVSPTSRTVTYNAAVGALPTPTRTGYTFARWNTAQDGSGTDYTAATVYTQTGNTTLYAQWNETYTLTFNANGGTVNPTSKTVNYNAAVGELPVPTLTGYTFAGWNTAQDGSGTTYTAATVYTQTGNLTLYAQWIDNALVRTLIFNANGGTVSPESKTVACNAAVGELPVPTRSGYTFAGWNTAQDGNGSSYTAATVYTQTGNLTLYAQWIDNALARTLIFNANGGTVIPASKTVACNAAVGELPAPTRSGYTFAGWNTAQNGSGTAYTAATVYTQTGNLTLYAQWTGNTYTLCFIANGGTVNPTSKTVTSNTAVGTLPTPTRSGYTFAEWNTAQNGSGTAYTATTVYTQTGNLTLYAQWTPQSSGSAALTFLGVSDGTLTPAFNASVTHYTVEVPNSVSSLTLNAVGVPGSTVTGAGVKSPATGSNTYNITVIAADNSVRVYTVVVTRLPLGTGVKDELQVNVTLYPNPFAGSLHLTGAEGCTLQVINAGGATVHTQKITAQDETVHLEGLPAGMYFFRLEKDGKTKTMKGIKN